MDRDLFQQRLRELGGLNRLEPDNEGAGAWIRYPAWEAQVRNLRRTEAGWVQMGGVCERFQPSNNLLVPGRRPRVEISEELRLGLLASWRESQVRGESRNSWIRAQQRRTGLSAWNLARILAESHKDHGDAAANDAHENPNHSDLD